MSYANLGPQIQAPLFKVTSADFQLTADQAFIKQGTFTKYVITKILAIRKTGGATVACLGGIYNAAAKGGDPLVAAAQSWLGLSGAGKITDATLLAILGTDVQTATPILALSTGSSTALTADVFIFGVVVD